MQVGREVPPATRRDERCRQHEQDIAEFEREGVAMENLGLTLAARGATPEFDDGSCDALKGRIADSALL